MCQEVNDYFVFLHNEHIFIEILNCSSFVYLIKAWSRQAYVQESLALVKPFVTRLGKCMFVYSCNFDTERKWLLEKGRVHLFRKKKFRF
jgi:hypothetical protein